MRNFYFRKSQTFLRAVLFFGVLGGLLFSCGEGIRLFPFSSEKAENYENARNQNKIPHQFNLHRFENDRNGFHAESHGNGSNSSPHLTNACGNYENPLFSPKAVSFQIAETELSAALKSRRLGNNRGKRAPPFFI